MNDENVDSLKEHAKHLRFVHFLVVITSLALIIAAVSPASEDVRRAKSDISDLNDRLALLKDVRWLERLAEQEFGDSWNAEEWIHSIRKQYAVEWMYEGIPRSFRANRIYPFCGPVTLVGPRIFASIEARAPTTSGITTFFHESKPYPGVTMPVEIATPTTIGEFRTFWNDLHNRYAYTPNGNLWSFEVEIEEIGDLGKQIGDSQFFYLPLKRLGYGNESKEPGSASSDPCPSGAPLSLYAEDELALSWSIVEESLGDRFRSHPEVESFFNEDAPWLSNLTHMLAGTVTIRDQGQRYRATVRIPVRMKQLRVSAQEYLRAEASRNWAAGTFEETFRELSRYTSGLDNLALGDVPALLDKLGDAEEGSIEIFGLAVKSTIVGRWGLTMLLGIQFYYALHLAAFFRLPGNSRALEFPWVGLYSDPLSKAAFYLSTTALPVSAAILVSSGVFYKLSTEGKWFQSSLVLATSVLSLMSIYPPIKKGP